MENLHLKNLKKPDININIITFFIDENNNVLDSHKKGYHDAHNITNYIYYTTIKHKRILQKEKNISVYHIYRKK